MGADYISYSIDKDLTPEQLRQDFSRRQSQAGHDHGMGGYSGSLYEAQGLDIRKEVFSDFRTADEWIMNHAQKWEAALAVRVIPPKGVRRPTDAAIKALAEKANAARDALYALQRAPLARIRKAKAKHIGCPKCKSKLAKEFLRSSNCPLCNEDLSTSSERARLKSANDKWEKARADYEAADALKRAPESAGWQVGAWCSS